MLERSCTTASMNSNHVIMENCFRLKNVFSRLRHRRNIQNVVTLYSNMTFSMGFIELNLSLPLKWDEVRITVLSKLNESGVTVTFCFFFMSVSTLYILTAQIRCCLSSGTARKSSTAPVVFTALITSSPTCRSDVCMCRLLWTLITSCGNPGSPDDSLTHL